MTKKEKTLLKTAINRLHDDDGWDDGISILKRLINPNWVHPLSELKSISIYEVLSKTEEKL